MPITRSITISEGISIKELSEKLEARARDVIKKLLDKGIFATINQTLDSQTATEMARAFAESVVAGRRAFKAGRARIGVKAVASSPVEGVPV